MIFNWLYAVSSHFHRALLCVNSKRSGHDNEVLEIDGTFRQTNMCDSNSDFSTLSNNLWKIAGVDCKEVLIEGRDRELI